MLLVEGSISKCEKWYMSLQLVGGIRVFPMKVVVLMFCESVVCMRERTVVFIVNHSLLLNMPGVECDGGCGVSSNECTMQRTINVR